MQLVKIIFIWFLGIMFMATGFSKLMRADAISQELFTRADYPHWLFITAGAFELLGGIMLVLEKTRRIGAMLIAVVMMGAMWIHIYLGENVAHLIVPALILTYAGFTVFKKQKEE